MKTIIKQEGNDCVAYFEGRLDTAAAVQTAEDVRPLLEVREGAIILDCQAMEYISSSGLRIFLTIRKEAAAHGCKVVVRNLRADVKQVFVMTGFISLFEIQ